MKKFILLTLLTTLISVYSHSQTTKPKPDSASIAQAQQQKETAEANKFIDSLTTKTSIKDFQLWLYENVSQKTAAEGKFGELYNLFLQQQYAAWVQRRAKPKK